MTEPDSKPNADSSAPRRIVQLVAGAALVLAGVAILLANLDMIELGQVWRYWPLVLIGVGVSKLTRAADLSCARTGGNKKNTDEGVWFCMIGAWLLVSNLKLFGLGYSKSWPLLILAVGISIVWSALAPEAPANTPAEEQNGR